MFVSKSSITSWFIHPIFAWDIYNCSIRGKHASFTPLEEKVMKSMSCQASNVLPECRMLNLKYLTLNMIISCLESERENEFVIPAAEGFWVENSSRTLDIMRKKRTKLFHSQEKCWLFDSSSNRFNMHTYISCKEWEMADSILHPSRWTVLFELFYERMYRVMYVMKQLKSWHGWVRGRERENGSVLCHETFTEGVRKLS